MEAAQKIFGGRFSLLRVAFDAAGSEIAVAIAPPAGQWHDMVENSAAAGEPPQAIEAPAALAHMNGLAPAGQFQEIQLLEVVSAEPPAEAGRSRAVVRRVLYFLRQKDFRQVARLGAVEQAQSALGSEAAHSLARGYVREANATGETGNRETELALAFEAAMPQEVGVNHALGKSEAQAGHQNVIELFPEECGIRFIVFHGLGSREELTVHSPDTVGIFD